MVYLDLVVLLNFLVDFLLLAGTNALAGYPPGWTRAAAAAALGGLYGGICLVPGFRFLGGSLWRIVFLGLMAVIAFGFGRWALRRGVLFVLLSMALGGVALGMGNGGVWSLIGSAGALWLLCVLGFRGRADGRRFTALELRHAGRRHCMTALLDTGNTLRDPITGLPVLVVGAEVAREMLGLTEEELASPVQTLANAAVPGLRLIPYRAVGQPGGMLLAMKMEEVRLGGKIWDCLVAFAPQKLGGDGYQALAGGMM